MRLTGLNARLKSIERLLEGGGSVVLYHGTTRKHLAKIMRQGLKASGGYGGAGTFGTYLSGSKDGALYWAKKAFMLDNGEKGEIERFDRKYGKRQDELLAILQVNIPASAIDKLRADMEQAEDVGFEGGPENWQVSLEQIGDVMFDGNIPASWLTVLSGV